MTGASNAEQIEYWNGAVGERWAAFQERLDLYLAEITDALLRFAAPRPGERILDVGCGSGTTTFLLAFKAGRDGGATGIDISVPMLNVARARARAQNAAVMFIEADASAYDFQPVFDLVCSRFGVMFFADPEAAFANLATALVRGGRLVFVCWRGLMENEWASEPLSAARDLLPPQEPTDPLAPGPFAFADRVRIEKILSDAGLRDIRVEAFDGTVSPGKRAEDAAETLLNIGPLARAAKEVDETTRFRIRAVLENVLANYTTPAGVALRAACWLVSAKR